MKKSDCWFYLKGCCNKGQDCAFFHNPLKKNKEPYVPRHKINDHNNSDKNSNYRSFSRGRNDDDDEENENPKPKLPVKKRQSLY